MVSPTNVPPSSRLTIGKLIRLLAPTTLPKRQKNLCQWPPDAFAIAAYLLNSSGVYQRVICNNWWTSVDPRHPSALIALGKDWRACAAGGRAAPMQVRRKWELLLGARSKRVHDLEKNRELSRALFDIVAAADEACIGMGLPTPGVRRNDPEHALYARANELLSRGPLSDGASSLCDRVDSELVSVLPKLHTPQVGLTFRSLTHHLALCPKDEVVPVWNRVFSALTQREEDRLNLLLMPHPHSVDAVHFQAVAGDRCGRHRMPPNFASFEYKVPDNKKWIRDEFPLVLQEAVRLAPGKKIHGVVFPELSLRTESELVEAYKKIAAVSSEAFLVAGVSERFGDRDQRESFNTAQFVVPMRKGEIFVCRQMKHHRWRVDAGQIKAYGLENQLETGKIWWENIGVADRELSVFALKRCLTFSLLVCEDLARQEPVSRLVRAIGPHLLITLLMDGPQLRHRWSGRYVTVFGEDPGCSVLTLTSRGMVDLSNKALGKRPKASNIALWRDSINPQIVHEISIRDRAGGVILSLTNRTVTEHSADGRSHAAVCALELADSKRDVIQVSVKKRPLGKRS